MHDLSWVAEPVLSTGTCVLARHLARSALYLNLQASDGRTITHLVYAASSIPSIGKIGFCVHLPGWPAIWLA